MDFGGNYSKKKRKVLWHMICELVKVFHGFSQVGDSYYRGYSFGNSKHGINSIVPIH
jgi:hypothetical protein